MNKRPNLNKEELKNAFMKEVGPLFSEAGKASDAMYTDRFGAIHVENPGTYSSQMTIAMVNDIMTLSLLLASSHKNESQIISDFGRMIEEKDIQIRRISDDIKGKRVLSPYCFDTSNDMVAQIVEIHKSNILNERPFIAYSGKLKKWVERLLKMDTWAAVLNSRDAITYMKEQAKYRVYDEDGNMIMGISDNDEKVVELLLSLEQLMLDSLIRISPFSKNAEKCFDTAILSHFYYTLC